MIYTAGYQGHWIDALEKIVVKLDALVVDIRFSPNSRIPCWTRDFLSGKLGSRYLWLHKLGNKNFWNGAEIELVDPVKGCEQVHELLPDHRNLILLCACKDASTCHRLTVANLLRGQGYEVQELDWSLADGGSIRDRE